MMMVMSPINDDGTTTNAKTRAPGVESDILLAPPLPPAPPSSSSARLAPPPDEKEDLMIMGAAAAASATASATAASTNARPDEEEDSRDVHRRNWKRKHHEAQGELLGGSDEDDEERGGRNVKRRRRRGEQRSTAFGAGESKLVPTSRLDHYHADNRSNPREGGGDAGGGDAPSPSSRPPFPLRSDPHHRLQEEAPPPAPIRSTTAQEGRGEGFAHGGRAATAAAGAGNCAKKVSPGPEEGTDDHLGALVALDVLAAAAPPMPAQSRSVPVPPPPHRGGLGDSIPVRMAEPSSSLLVAMAATTTTTTLLCRHASRSFGCEGGGGDRGGNIDDNENDADDADDPNRPCRVIQFVAIASRTKNDEDDDPMRWPSRVRDYGGINHRTTSTMWSGRYVRAAGTRGGGAAAAGKRRRGGGGSDGAGGSSVWDGSTDSDDDSDDSTSSTSTSSSTSSTSTDNSSRDDGEASSVASDLTTDPRLFAVPVSAAATRAAASETDWGNHLDVDDDDDEHFGNRGRYRLNLPPEVAWRALVVLSILIILLDFVWTTVSDVVIRVVHRPRRKNAAAVPAPAQAVAKDQPNFESATISRR